jgi:hypothetical protein
MSETSDKPRRRRSPVNSVIKAALANGGIVTIAADGVITVKPVESDKASIAGPDEVERWFRDHAH